ncbi:MAG: ornithine carbamoyltransferase [Deltaproteobacteria bacterium]|nr:MAG: ornithine carbamoyltransferase [Deltaproteobacteria bacterium]
MAVELKGRDFVTLRDFIPEEIEQILDTADMLKLQQKMRMPHPLLPGRTLGMIFQKPSLRTRVSFEVGMNQLGGHALVLQPNEIKLGERETVEDVAKVLSRYVDAIMARTFGHDIVEELARHSRVPVINGLSDAAHPCQILADLMTIREKKGRLAGISVAWIGDGNNVATSLAFGCARCGVDLRIATPKGYELPPAVLDRARQDARATGASITTTNDPFLAAEGADVLYTDVWASMGQEEEAERRKRDFTGFQVNRVLLERAASDAIVLHCLPAHYDEEITYDVVTDPRSAIFDQAENRLHAQKALLSLVVP